MTPAQPLSTGRLRWSCHGVARQAELSCELPLAPRCPSPLCAYPPRVRRRAQVRAQQRGRVRLHGRIAETATAQGTLRLAGWGELLPTTTKRGPPAGAQGSPAVRRPCTLCPLLRPYQLDSLPGGMFGTAGVPTRPAGYTGDGSRADSGIPPAASRPLHSLTHEQVALELKPGRGTI
jgi:hypothetical protein